MAGLSLDTLEVRCQLHPISVTDCQDFAFYRATISSTWLLQLQCCEVGASGVASLSSWTPSVILLWGLNERRYVISCVALVPSWISDNLASLSDLLCYLRSLGIRYSCGKFVRPCRRRRIHRDGRETPGGLRGLSYLHSVERAIHLDLLVGHAVLYQGQSLAQPVRRLQYLVEMLQFYPASRCSIDRTPRKRRPQSCQRSQSCPECYSVEAQHYEVCCLWALHFREHQHGTT